MPPITGTLDDFNRANETLGAPLWEDYANALDGGLTLVGNRIECVAGDERASVYTADDFGGTFESYVDVVSLGGSSAVYLFGGIPGTLDQYTAYVRFQLDGIGGATLTVSDNDLLYTEEAVDPGDVGALWLRCTGLKLQGYYYDGVDWVLFGEHNCPPLPGYLGLSPFGSGATAIVDNFGGGTIPQEFPPGGGLRPSLALHGGHPVHAARQIADPLGIGVWL